MRSFVWLVGLGVRFLSVAPLRTASAILLIIISQLLSVLSFFIPLKVVILLGSNSLPSYLPSAFQIWDRNSIIATLAGLSIIFYLGHRASDKYVSSLTSSVVDRLSKESGKLLIFENQIELASSAYQRYAQALAGFIFGIVSIAGMLFFYPFLSLGVVLFLIVSSIYIFFYWRRENALTREWESEFGKKMNDLSGVGFFFMFILLVSDFLFFSHPSVYVAIFCLLIGRQMYSRLGAALYIVAGLIIQRAKLDSILKEEVQYRPPVLSSENVRFFSRFAPEKRLEWLGRLLCRALGQDIEITCCEWHQLGLTNVVAVKAETTSGNFIIKVYDRNRRTWAEHEATLAAEAENSWPIPNFVYAAEFEGHRCLVYSVGGGRRVNPDEASKIALDIRRVLLKIEPPADLAARYLRSHALLWQRFGTATLEDLFMAANTQSENDALRYVISLWGEVRETLQRLPLMLISPDIGPGAGTLWKSEDGTGQLIDWGRWGVEPLGAGWPVVPDRLGKLDAAIVDAKLFRPEISGVSGAEVRLCALVFALENDCRRQLFSHAIVLVGEVAELLQTEFKPKTC